MINSISLKRKKIDALIVAGSAGTIEILLKLIPALPKKLDFAIIIILHLPENRLSKLADILQSRTTYNVIEAEDKQKIESGMIYTAGNGYHLSVEKDFRFSLSCEPPLNFSRPSIDILMESAAAAYGERLMGILLTGANTDGALGMKKIKELGGFTIVQDPAEAEYRMMPEEAIKLMRPELVLKLEQILKLIMDMGMSDGNK